MKPRISIITLGPDDLAEDANVPAEGAGFNRFALACNVNSEEEVDETLTKGP